MKMLFRAALSLLALAACVCGLPAYAQHAATSLAPAGYAPEYACVTWSGASIGSGSLIPCGTGSGGGGGGSNAAAASTGATAGAFASQTGYVGSDGKVYNWVGDLLGHPLVSIFGTVAATQSGTWNVGLTGNLPAFATTPTFKVDQTTPGNTNGVNVNHSSYTLLTGGTTAGATNLLGDTYSLSLPSAFNGATINVTFTAANGTTQVNSYTSAPATPPVFSVYAGTSVTATASGGTPTGNTVLAGGPAAGGGAVALSASEVHIGEVSTHGFSLSSTAFARPADTTAYSAGSVGDLVGNSTNAALVVPISFNVARINGGSGRIVTVRLWTSSINTTNAQFRIHFYSAAPTVANGDNGVWSTSGYNSGSPTWLGSADVVVNTPFSDGAAGQGYATIGSYIPFKAGASSTTIYALIEARAAYTPTSAETFVVSIAGDTD